MYIHINTHTHTYTHVYMDNKSGADSDSASDDGVGATRSDRGRGEERPQAGSPASHTSGAMDYDRSLWRDGLEDSSLGCCGQFKKL